MAKVVSAIFKTRSSANLAVEDLIRHGINQEDVSMLLTDTMNGREFAVHPSTEAANGALVGIGLLAPLMGLFALLIALGNMPPVVPALVAINPMVAICAGLGAGSIMGAVAGTIIGWRLPVYEASFFSTQPITAGILVGVYADGARKLEVRKVLDAAGGVFISERSIASHPLIRTQSTGEHDIKISH